MALLSLFQKAYLIFKSISYKNPQGLNLITSDASPLPTVLQNDILQPVTTSRPPNQLTH